MTFSVPKGFQILPAGGALTQVLARLHRLSFDQAWEETALAGLLALPGAFGLIACGGKAFETPAGFVLVRVAGDEGEILTLGVDPAWRRSGVATALMQHAMHQVGGAGAVTLFLEVAVSNLAARDLYARLGFAKVGERIDYYAHPQGERETALILRANIVSLTTDRYDGGKAPEKGW